MIRITVLEPVGLPPALTQGDSPVWQDSAGVLYRVSSGLTDILPENAWLPEHGPIPRPEPQTTVIVARIDGLEALDAMGLSRIAEAGPDEAD